MKNFAVSTSRKNYRPGQAMTEFAVVATAFLLIFFAIMEMAEAVFAYNSISAAAREAARYAMVHSSTSANPASTAQIQQIAINAAPSVPLTTSNVTVSWPNDPRVGGKKDAEIQVSYNFHLKIPFMSAATLQLTSTSQMLVSQ